jgi:hypothetical protein
MCDTAGGERWVNERVVERAIVDHRRGKHERR